MNRKILLACSTVLVMSNFYCKDQARMDAEANKDTAKTEASTNKEAVKTVVFFGNSLTAGYGLEPAQSFPSLIQEKIDSADLKYRVVNAGVSGETSAGGNGRIDWILKQQVDVFVLELGANDGLRGIPVDETKRNLQGIIDKVKNKYPQAKLVLAGMQIPPNMGEKYASDFRDVFPDIARQNKMALVPFLLAGVGGVRELNQQDGIHPTAKGARIVAENVWNVLKQILDK
jgi:acyl-CoA thioesterase-1